MTRAFKWIYALVFENFWWKMLSLTLAVVLWVIVASEPELSTNVAAPVEYKNLADDLEISSEPVTSVVLELRGPSGELRGGGGIAIRPAVVLDMGNVTPGQRTFTVDTNSVKLTRGLRLIRAHPSEVRFDFERRMVRSVPVVVGITGEGQNGYVLSAKQVTPAELSVVGPASRVARIKDVSTDAVDVSNVVGSSDFHVNAFVEDPYVRFQSSPMVSVEVTMKKR